MLCEWGEKLAPQTSCSTTEARSSPCSASCMKFSPRIVPTTLCPIASRRSGRKAWITSNWWTIWPMFATKQGADTNFNCRVSACENCNNSWQPTLANRPYPSSFESHYESQASCIVFILKVSFHSHTDKTNMRSIWKASYEASLS